TARLERTQVGIDRVDRRPDFFIDDLEIAIEIERARVPIGIAIGDLERSDRHTGSLRTVADEGRPSRFAARILARTHDLAARGLRRGIRALGLRDLRGGETVLRIARLARKRRDVERPGPWSAHA